MFTSNSLVTLRGSIIWASIWQCLLPVSQLDWTTLAPFLILTVAQLPQADMHLSSAFMVRLSSLCITTIRKVFLFPLPVSSHQIFEYLRMASIICPKERWLFGPNKQGLCSHHPAFLKMPITVSSLWKVTKTSPVSWGLHYSKPPECPCSFLCSGWEAQQTWWLCPWWSSVLTGWGAALGSVDFTCRCVIMACRRSLSFAS